MTGSGAKPPPTMEENIANISAQIEKLVGAYASIKVDAMSLQDSVTTLQGSQGQLMVAVNRLQSDKLEANFNKAPPAQGKTDQGGPSDAAMQASKHGHKLLFLTFDDSEDPLPWLNRCDQFFCVQETPEEGKIFLVTFYMSGEASQWYTLLERNRGKPSWAEFVKLVNQRFGPPLRHDPLGELIQLRHEGTVADYQSKFLSLLGRCEDLTEKHQINIFTAVLRNPLRVEAVQAWPRPRTVRAMRSLLGLTEYYQKFIRSYSDIAAPLTQLLKKEALCWTPTATTAFDALKTTLTSAPVLQLPDFTKTFTVDCDASGSGFRQFCIKAMG
jgi:hypothetical protein